MRPPRKRDGAVLKSAAFVVLIFAVYIVTTIITSQLPLNVIDQTIITDVVLAVGCVVALMRIPKPLTLPRAELTGTRINPNQKIAIAVTFIVMWVTGQLTAAWLYQRFDNPAAAAQRAAKLGDVSALSVLILGLIVAPIAEELVFRRTIYAVLRWCSPALVSAIITSLLFALMHGTVSHLGFTFTMGLFLSFVYERTRNIKHAIALHTLFNLLSFTGMLNMETNVATAQVIIANLLLLPLLIVMYRMCVTNTHKEIDLTDTSQSSGDEL